jgi:MFS family permease
MGNRDDPGVRRAARRRYALAAAALGLLIVAAAVAPDGLPYVDRSPSPDIVLPQPPQALVALLVLVGIGAVAFYLWTRLERARRAPQRRSRRGSLVPLAAVFVALTLWVAFPEIREWVSSILGDVGAERARPRQSDLATSDDLTIERAETLGYAIAAIVALALATIAAASIWLLRAGPSAAPASSSPAADSVDAHLQASMVDLEHIADPRAAVVACYAHMQAAASSVGIEPRPSDAPFESLARLLASVSAPAPAARRLTELFEVARFSPHEVTDEMRADALRALDEVRARLAHEA